ncbi:hypothetical protein GCM10023340_34860 [Nocardioides marinquilinus]|uniref:Uncharacterized protein n=1 Tax=Nocardioides marinquilinus TaxID=1210400 RepID=A0ABP9PWR9_9ACTN
MSRLVPTSDLAPARWLVEATPLFGGRVAEMLPGGYETYVRVFHRPDQGRPEEGSATTWAEVAERHDTMLHPEAQWWSLTGGRLDSPHSTDEDGPADGPASGSLDPLTLPRLARHLGQHTDTPGRCHVALWDGTGASPRSWEACPRFMLPGRAHWLFPPVPVADVVRVAVAFELQGREEQLAETGRLRNLFTFGHDRPLTPSEVTEVCTRFLRRLRADGDLQSPSWWWPDDRAWIVHSEVDLDSTLVAGPRALLAALLDDPGIECLEVTRATSLLANADRVNVAHL